jgi:nucleotide-binding universal stress UspA family protein
MPATQMQKRVAFRSILFATDFSASANLAIPYAAGLARSFGATLYAMHVQEPINYALPPETWQSLELTREMEIQALSQSIKHDFPEVTPHMLIGEGIVSVALESAVEKHEIDLIVVGTRGRTGLGKAVLGSQAEKILRTAKCPVLTVGPRACTEQDRTRGKIASILFATDFGPASLKAVPIAVSLAEEYQSKLTLLHVVQYREVNEMTTPADFGESCERQLRALVPEEARLWCEPHFIVERGQPAEGILYGAQRAQADLIVLGVHRPSGLPGASNHLPTTVHNVITFAECPVLTVTTENSPKKCTNCQIRQS